MSSCSSSAASSPVEEAKYVPFQPAYCVSVSEPVKNGDVVQYTVKTKQISDDAEEVTVTRQYEDFEYLHHCLHMQNPHDGIIMPPLPARPVVDARDAEMKSKKYLGLTSRTLIGDELDKDCRHLEKYLQLVVGHEHLGRSSCLKEFLLETQAPAGAAVKPGIFGKLWSVTEIARKANHADIDDYFQKVRDAANNYAASIQQSSNAFNHVIHCQQRVEVAYSELSTTLSSLTAASTDHDQQQPDPNRLLAKFGEAIDAAKHGMDAEIINDENTLGFWLDLYARYSQNVKEMLFKRTCLMINYEDANRALDKAKPAKKSSMETAKWSAETAFEDCSQLARRELSSYDHQRVVNLHSAVSTWAEEKIRTARDTYTQLEQSLQYFRQLDTSSS